MDDDKLGKRRATNRRSQKRTREHKESLMKSLQEENELLKERLENRPVLTLLVTRMLKLYLEHHPTGSQGV